MIMRNKTSNNAKATVLKFMAPLAQLQRELPEIRRKYLTTRQRCVARKENIESKRGYSADLVGMLLFGYGNTYPKVSIFQTFVDESGTLGFGI